MLHPCKLNEQQIWKIDLITARSKLEAAVDKFIFKFKIVSHLDITYKFLHFPLIYFSL